MKVLKNLLNFKLRQHLIYLILPIIVAVLVNEGGWYLIFILLVYIRRFPKTYWVYFLIFILALSYYRGLEKETLLDREMTLDDVTGFVVEIKKQTDVKQVAVVEVDNERVYFTTSCTEPRLLPGDYIKITGELQIPNNTTIFHGFDFKTYLNNQNIQYTLFSDDFYFTHHQFTIMQWQYQLASKIEQTFPPMTTAYLKAWLLGITDGLDEEIQDTYSNLGIIHLFAISGLHVGLLSSLFSYVLKRLGIIEEVSQILLIIALFLFMVISGASASIVRASGMSILFILNHRLNLKLSSLDVFSLILLINILLNPLQVYQLGFIYSYWLTFVLICLQATFKALKPQTLFFFLPFIAQLASAPLQLYFYYELNVLSYLINLLIIPLVSMFLLPLLLMTVIFSFIAPMTEYLLALFEGMMQWSSTFLFWNWRVGSYSLNFLIGILFLFLLSCYWFERKLNVLIWIISVSLIVFLFEGHYVLVNQSTFTMLDVGQGDSFVIQSPFRQCNIVVDTGGQSAYNGKSKEIFSNTLEPFLKGEGIRKIDYLILTHGDFDHAGEAISLLKTFHVNEILINQYPMNELMKEIEQVAHQMETKIRSVNQGDTLLCGNQRLKFLQSNQMKESENEASLVFTLQMDGFSGLLTGDMGITEEDEILKHYSLEQLTVYKAAHHGSKMSNSYSFLKQLNPMISIVSSGRNNRYGHPSVTLIENLNQLQIPLLNTQIHGSIRFKVKEGEIWIESKPPYNSNI